MGSGPAGFGLLERNAAMWLLRPDGHHLAGSAKKAKTPLGLVAGLPVSATS